jgi:RNA methyltransferase, TrmH family
MHEPAITSAKNARIKRLREVREGKHEGFILAEGVRLCEEALGAGLVIEEVLIAPRLLVSERGAALAAALQGPAAEYLDTSDAVMEKVSALKTHQGVMLVARTPEWKETDYLRGDAPFVLVACGVQDPGNLGGLVRTAEAAGASGFIALRGSAHPYRDKAVRGSSGSCFRLPCWPQASAEDVLAFFEKHGVTLITTDSTSGQPLWDLGFGAGPQAFLLGSEGGGVPKRLREHAKLALRIPMQAPVESLNVSVAAGLVLFEHRRRRLQASSSCDPSVADPSPKDRSRA